MKRIPMILLLKLSQVPLISLILLFTLVMAMVGGEGIRTVAIAALLACWLLMLSSSVFGISGFCGVINMGYYPKRE